MSKEWLRYNLGPTYELRVNKVVEKTPAGERDVLSLEARGHLTDGDKQKIWDQETRFRNSKWGKQSYNNYDMHEKWHKDIKSRRYTEKREVEHDGDSQGKGVFDPSTGERLS